MIYHRGRRAAGVSHIILTIIFLIKSSVLEREAASRLFMHLTYVAPWAGELRGLVKGIPQHSLNEHIIFHKCPLARHHLFERPFSFECNLKLFFECTQWALQKDEIVICQMAGHSSLLLDHVLGVIEYAQAKMLNTITNLAQTWKSRLNSKECRELNFTTCISCGPE